MGRFQSCCLRDDSLGLKNVGPQPYGRSTARRQWQEKQVIHRVTPSAHRVPQREEMALRALCPALRPLDAKRLLKPLGDTLCALGVTLCMTFFLAYFACEPIKRKRPHPCSRGSEFGAERMTGSIGRGHPSSKQSTRRTFPLRVPRFHFFNPDHSGTSAQGALSPELQIPASPRPHLPTSSDHMKKFLAHLTGSW